MLFSIATAVLEESRWLALVALVAAVLLRRRGGWFRLLLRIALVAGLVSAGAVLARIVALYRAPGLLVPGAEEAGALYHACLVNCWARELLRSGIFTIGCAGIAAIALHCHRTRRRCALPMMLVVTGCSLPFVWFAFTAQQQIRVARLDSDQGRQLRARGFIPDSVPPDSSDLEIVYEVEANRACGTFKSATGWRAGFVGRKVPRKLPPLCHRLAGWAELVASGGKVVDGWDSWGRLVRLRAGASYGFVRTLDYGDP
jgi:hypothetical protein